MYKNRVFWYVLSVVAVGFGRNADATVGYFSNGYDAESKSMAGIGVSMGDGPVATANNPALGLKLGNMAGGCLSLFMPHREETNSRGANAGFSLNEGTYHSSQELFEIPCLGVNYKADDSTAVGMVIYANGGMNTHYKGNPLSGFGGLANPQTPYGSDIEQVFTSVNLARDVAHGVTLGLAPIFAAQRVNMQGVQQFDNATNSTAPGAVTNNGYDYSYGGGAKIGVLYDPADWLTLGINYQTRVWMTKFDRYRGLFAEQGGFDIPPSLTEGLTLRPMKGLDVSVEHETIYYSQIRSIHNDGRAGGGLLGSDGGAGFGWQNMQVYRIGGQWKATDDLTLRTGYSYNSAFTKTTQMFFNTLAPATPQHHLAVGGSYDITPAWSVSLSYVHAFSNSMQGPNQNDTTQTIKLRMDQDEATIGLKFKW